jgi:hypothetical protein
MRKNNKGPGEIADDAIKALMMSDRLIFQRGEELVRLIHRPDGRLRIGPVEEVWLAEQVATELKRKKLCHEVAKTILARKEWPFRPLVQLRHAPTISRFGGIIEVPGYDDESGLYLDVKVGEFPLVPQNPSIEEATAALKMVEEELLSGYVFEDEVSRSVALSAFLTGIKRPTMQTAPMHVFDAPMPGCGKSLLAETTGILATGEKPAPMSQADKEEENEKRLDVMLRNGDEVIIFDNCDRPIKSGALASTLTSQHRQSRVLGKSDRYLLETSATILITGNNIEFRGDLARRAVICRINPKVDQPDAREFDFDPRVRATENRGRYVTALNTALRAYYVHGKPVRPTPMGSFEDYGDIRGTLIMCGYADPAESRKKVQSINEDELDFQDVIESIRDEIGEVSFMVKDLKDRLDYSRTREALVHAARCETWNPRAIGKYLGLNRGRTCGGYQIVALPRRRWQLVNVGGTASKS